jgi:hypothetical protein
MSALVGKIITDYRDNLKGAKFAFAGMNFMIDPADLPIESGQCVDICNCDIDNQSNVSRRTGSTLVTAGSISNAWSNNEMTYCTVANRLSSINMSTGQITTIGGVQALQNTVEFKQVNDVVVFSDSVIIGVLEGTVATIIANATLLAPSDSAIATRVTDTYPADFQATASNFNIDTFKDNTFGGKCLEYFNGRLYFAKDNFVYCTKAFDIEHIDVRYAVVAGFPEDVTAIARVNDGLFIGTSTNTYFLRGTSPDPKDGGFTQTHIAKYGIIYGTVVRFQGDIVADAKTKNTVVLWSSTLGVFCGTEGGMYTCLSLNQITVPAGDVGTAIVREQGGIYQYIVCYDSLTTVVLNLSTSTHSRYVNFLYNSLFRFGTSYYGANASGLFKLEGDTDNGSSINAFITTPVINFNKDEKKAVPDAFINARANDDIELDITINEDQQCLGLVIPFTEASGIKQRRVKVPNSLNGSSWQFTLRNTNGAYFKIFDFEVSAKTLQRTI